MFPKRLRKLNSGIAGMALVDRSGNVDRNALARRDATNRLSRLCDDAQPRTPERLYLEIEENSVWAFRRIFSPLRLNGLLQKCTRNILYLNLTLAGLSSLRLTANLEMHGNVCSTNLRLSRSENWVATTSLSAPNRSSSAAFAPSVTERSQSLRTLLMASMASSISLAD